MNQGENNPWGRDVRDYYEIKFKDDKRETYLFNGEWKKTSWRIDTIKIKGKKDFIDSVAYVQLGNDPEGSTRCAHAPFSSRQPGRAWTAV